MRSCVDNEIPASDEDWSMSIASMRTTQVSGLGPVTVYIARFKCRPGLSLPLPAGLGPPESSTGPSTLNTFTLPTFLPGRARFVAV